MFRRYLNPLSLYLYPPDTGAGAGGGSSDNVAASGSTDTSVTSGTASPEMIAAATASESSSEKAPSASAAESLARAAESAEDTTTVDGVVKPVATGAAKVPSQATGQPETGANRGPVPLDRHEAAVKNARQAGADEAIKEYAWAKGLDRESVGTAFTLVREILADTPAFVRKLAAEAGLQVVETGTPATAGAAGTAATGKSWKDGIPKGALRAESGEEAFSKEQVVTVLEGAIESLRQELTGQLKPLLSGEEKRAQLERDSQITTEARQQATTHMAELRKLPHFQIADHTGKMMDHPKIGVYLNEIPVKERIQNPVAAFYRAYNTYMEKDVLPTLGTAAANKVRDENKMKAASSMGAHPSGSARSTVTPPIKGVTDLARRMEDMASGKVAIPGA